MLSKTEKTVWRVSTKPDRLRCFVVSSQLGIILLSAGAPVALADQRPEPPSPNACAETACAAIRASAQMVCSEQMWDADACEVALADLQQCFDKCVN
ncbi:MAG: hypothetical protein HY899_15095 [Deltaproteobacteria bacterium]|nr:hypothetical protein [Deltaproteobacteria bacterium]